MMNLLAMMMKNCKRSCISFLFPVFTVARWQHTIFDRVHLLLLWYFYGTIITAHSSLAASSILLLILARTEQSLWPEGTFTTREYLLLPFYIAKAYLLLLLLHSFLRVDILLLPGYICNFYSTVIIAKVQLLQHKVLNCN